MKNPLDFTSALEEQQKKQFEFQTTYLDLLCDVSLYLRDQSLIRNFT